MQTNMNLNRGGDDRVASGLTAARAQVATLTRNLASSREDADDQARVARKLGEALARQAAAYQADAKAAPSDADRFAVARRAAEVAAAACGRQTEAVPGAVHRALAGEPVTPEDAPLSASMKGALEALRKGRR